MADRADGPSIQRRTAAVLALDLEVSQPDPELAGPMLSSIVDALRPITVPFGGWLDAGSGGRVTVVFVPPFIHDAPLVSAVRAASALRERLDDIDLPHAFGWRIGISKGEVLLEGVEIGSSSIFGDALSTARRLAHEASDGEIVLEGRSLAPIEGIVEVAPRVDGAWSLRSVRTGERRKDTLSLTGRHRELQVLLDGFERAVHSSRCERVVVTGGPGLGKSRLLEAFRDEIQPNAHVLTGYCDPAGGRALRPVAEMIERWLSTIPGVDVEAKLERFLDDSPGADQITGDVMQLLGRSTSTATTASISWSLRQLIERLAAERPVALVFEDVHWGRDLLVDTIEYLTGFITDKPVFIICASRPDLPDRSEAFGHVSTTNTVLALEPLGLQATTELVEGVLRRPVAEDVAGEVHRISKGNPLFAIELAEEWRRSSQQGGSLELGARAAPTLQALLETRVAGVETEARPILEAAAVAGERFDVAHVAAAQGWEQIAALLQLARLAEHHLVEAAPSSAALGRDEFRFGHALIQETVYRMTQKERRVNLHQRFAELELEVAAGVDQHERAGYHLERAAALSAELGRSGEEVSRLRDGAASLFAKAGRELMASGDVGGVATLLQKAIDLLTSRGAEWANTAIDLADVYVQLGDYERARALTQEVGDLAERSSSAVQKERAALAAGWLRAATVITPQPDLVADLEALAPFFERRADHTALAKLYLALAECHWTAGENGAVVEVLQLGMGHSLRSPSQRHLSRMAPFMASALLWGPTPTDAALAECNLLLEVAAADRLAQARVKVVAGVLEALRGNFDNATRLTEQGVSAHEEAGSTVVGLVMTQFTALVEILAGDLHSAAVELERGLAGMRALGVETHVATSMAMLGQVRYRMGDADAAVALISEALALGEGEVSLIPDAYPTLGHIAADRGDPESALRYLEGAARDAGARDVLLSQAQISVENARVLAKLGVDRDELERAITEASELCRRKGAPVLELRLPSPQGEFS